MFFAQIKAEMVKTTLSSSQKICIQYPLSDENYKWDHKI